METKFTPGPWFSDQEGNVWRREPAELYQNGGKVAGDKPIAVTRRGWTEEGEIGYPFKDNARLIAAAPELFAALQEAIEIIESLDGRDNSCNPMTDISDLRAVLAKSTGEQA